MVGQPAIKIMNLLAIYGPIDFISGNRRRWNLRRRRGGYRPRKNGRPPCATGPHLGGAESTNRPNFDRSMGISGRKGLSECAPPPRTIRFRRDNDDKLKDAQVFALRVWGDSFLEFGRLLEVGKLKANRIKTFWFSEINTGWPLRVSLGTFGDIFLAERWRSVWRYIFFRSV